MKHIGVIDRIKESLIFTIEEQSIPEPNSGCFIWMGATNHSGYGRISVAREAQSAHRVSYFCFVEDPGELCVLHRCDNTLCVNPMHLFAGTQKQNVGDMINKGRRTNSKGNSNPRSILSPDDVAEIRSSHEKQKDLAVRFGVARSTINAVKTGKNWSNI